MLLRQYIALAPIAKPVKGSRARKRLAVSAAPTLGAMLSRHLCAGQSSAQAASDGSTSYASGQPAAPCGEGWQAAPSCVFCLPTPLGEDRFRHAGSGGLRAIGRAALRSRPQPNGARQTPPTACCRNPGIPLRQKRPRGPLRRTLQPVTALRRSGLRFALPHNRFRIPSGRDARGSSEQGGCFPPPRHGTGVRGEHAPYC